MYNSRRTPTGKPPTRSFLEGKIRTLLARAGKLTQLTPHRVGIRREDVPFAPSPAHFAAANKRLADIRSAIDQRVSFLKQHWASAPPQAALLYIAMVEREVDRARRAFGMFFEVFSQRGSTFAPALAAHDAIAADCYRALRESGPSVFRGALLKPITYMEHGYSPATMRRGVALSRLLGENNPFPLIRIPWDRDNPWQPVFLHEVAHNLQADMGLWQENKNAVEERMLRAMGEPGVVSAYGRWHKEIFADLAAILLGGPASVWGMMEFLAHPPPKVLTFMPGGAHPTGYLRGLLLAEMLRQMGFGRDAARATAMWKSLYRPAAGHRIPKRLIETAPKSISNVVDEIAFQPRRGLAQRALVDVIQFTPENERDIRAGATYLARGVVPGELPPRFLVSAARYALGRGAPTSKLSDLLIDHLSGRAIGRQPLVPAITALAA